MMSLNTSLRDILDEEGTLVKSVYQKVTFHQSGCSIQDPVSRKSWWWASEFLGIEKLIYFSLIRRKQKLTRTLLHCSVEDFLTAWMSSTLSGQWLWIPARQCSVTPRKSHASVSTTKHSDFIAADEWASYSSDLNPLDYCIWDILRIRVWCIRRPTTSICKSTKPERGNQKQMEGGHLWDSSKIHCTMEKNDWMRLESRIEARFSIFSANHCDWTSISCSETCWNYCYFVLFGRQILFHVFHCQNKNV